MDILCIYICNMDLKRVSKIKMRVTRYLIYTRNGASSFVLIGALESEGSHSFFFCVLCVMSPNGPSEKNNGARWKRYNDATSASSHILHITSYPNSSCTQQLVNSSLFFFFNNFFPYSSALFVFMLFVVDISSSRYLVWVLVFVVVIGLRAWAISIAMIHLVSGCYCTHIGISQISDEKLFIARSCFGARVYATLSPSRIPSSALKWDVYAHFWWR